eukprot:COSAG02_NODE_427_length_22498_cov_11.745212_11_plen_656_part_00
MAEEPGAPPPSTTFDVEPSAPPPTPEASVGDAGMMAEASSWFSQSFNLQICGKRISSDAAKTIIMGAGAAIVVLVVALAVTLSGNDEVGAERGTDAVPMPPPPSNSVNLLEYGAVDSIFLGCFAAGSGLEVTEAQTMPRASASPDACAAICDRQGSTEFGLLNYDKCICGNTHSAVTVDASRCNTPCPGAGGSIMCGGHKELSVYSLQPPDVLAGVEQFSYIGCYIDDEQNRDLTGLGVTMGQTASAETCARLCGGYPYFGLQYYSMCFCGTTYNSLGRAREPQCNTPCDGDANTQCGGYQFNSIYRIESSSVAVDVISGGADETFEYVGCYVDAAERSMNNNNEANGNEAGSFGDLGPLATTHLCADMCAGFEYFGLQYSSQCFCGNEYDSSDTLGDAAESDCNMPCNGDPDVMCGGSWRNSVYHITGQVDLDVLETAVTYAYKGCYVDQGTRDLEGQMFNMGEQATTRVCAELCVGSTYFGTQAGQQCFCGMTYGDYGAATDDAAECNSECFGHATGGDTHAMCGGSWRNSVYEITSANDLIQLPPDEPLAEYSYIGCFVDQEPRDLGGMDSSDHGELANATPQLCADFCRDGHFDFFALQYYSECFCGNEFGHYGSAPEAECNTACRGDDSVMCGGPWRNSVFSVRPAGDGR